MDKKKTMKICVSSVGENLESEIDPRFGRCEYFVIVETSDHEIVNIEAVKNVGANQDSGAGIGATEQIGNLAVDVLITGGVGPKAKDALEKLDIEVCKKSGVAMVAVNEYLNDNKIESGNETVLNDVEVKDSEENMDNQRIFIPLMDDNGKSSEISLHFGHAPFFGLYNVASKNLTITENKLDHNNPDTTPVNQIVEQVDPSVVFAQDMGARAISLFKEKNITLKTGPYKTVNEVIDNIDKLEDLTKGCDH